MQLANLPARTRQPNPKQPAYPSRESCPTQVDIITLLAVTRRTKWSHPSNDRNSTVYSSVGENHPLRARGLRAQEKKYPTSPTRKSTPTAHPTSLSAVAHYQELCFSPTTDKSVVCQYRQNGKLKYVAHQRDLLAPQSIHCKARGPVRHISSTTFNGRNASEFARVESTQDASEGGTSNSEAQIADSGILFNGLGFQGDQEQCLLQVCGP